MINVKLGSDFHNLNLVIKKLIIIRLKKLIGDLLIVYADQMNEQFI